MVEDCAGAFLDEKGAAEYRYSGEHGYYKDALENVYRPLVSARLIEEYENNNFGIPKGSRLEKICRSKEPIEWSDLNL